MGPHCEEDEALENYFVDCSVDLVVPGAVVVLLVLHVELGVGPLPPTRVVRFHRVFILTEKVGVMSHLLTSDFDSFKQLRPSGFKLRAGTSHHFTILSCSIK